MNNIVKNMANIMENQSKYEFIGANCTGLILVKDKETNKKYRIEVKECENDG